MKEINLLYADSFKMITRNFEKIFKMLEFLLQQDATFVTSNYYIENGYLEKRDPILKAAHSFEEINLKLLNDKGLLNKHLMAIRCHQNSNFEKFLQK